MVGLARIVVVVCVDVALMQCARVMLSIAVAIRRCVVYELAGAMFPHMFVVLFSFFDNEFGIHRVVLVIQTSPEHFLNLVWV